MINYATLDFEALCALPNDGRKKFYLLKNFGREVPGYPPLKLREFGCDKIEALIRFGGDEIAAASKN
jgi:hypothetical protein